MCPGALADAIVTRQSLGPAADVGHSLNAVVAAKDIAAAAGFAHITEDHLEMAVGSNDTGTVVVLGAAHGPENRARPVLSHYPGYPLDVCRRDTRNIGSRFGIVLCYFFLQPFEIVSSLGDELLVLPSFGENDVDQAIDERHVCARAQPDVFVGERGSFS